jgi:tripartite motif-containing protein 71
MVILRIVLLAAILVWAQTARAAEAVPVLGSWGSFGSGPGQFKYPAGIAVDGSGYVYVADRDNYRIQKFTKDGTFVLQWGGVGTANGSFDKPTDVAVGPDGSVYTTEDNNHRVQKFTSTGTFLTKWGQYGSCDGSLHWPGSIAVDASGNVYVSDRLNYRIQKFSDTGAFITKWGSWTTPCDPGDWENALIFSQLCVKESGNILTGELNTRSIYEFTNAGNSIAQWACCGIETPPGTYAAPGGVAQGNDGKIYVGIGFGDKIQVFSSSGVLIDTFGSTGTEEGQFNFPGALAVNDSGTLFVCDVRNHRIQKFSIDGGTTPIKTSTWGRLKAIYR